MSQCLLSTRPPILNCVYYMVSPFPAETSQSQFPPPPSFSPLTLNLNLSFSPAGDGVLFCSFFSFLPVHSNFEVIAPFSFVPRLYLSRYVNPSNLSCCHPFFFFFVVSPLHRHDSILKRRFSAACTTFAKSPTTIQHHHSASFSFEVQFSVC